jgi:hypothetical protein
MNGPIVWVTVDESRGLALVTGKHHDSLVTAVAPDSKWSRAGRGWVITLEQATDLACLCDHERVPYRERAAT